MSEARFRDVNADVAQFADTIHNHAAAESVEELVRSGFALLSDVVYPEAARRFSAAVAADPACAEAHFGLALALLQGTRPHRHGESSIRRIEGHLRAGAALVEARVLELLVAEDYRLAWQHVSRRIPAHVLELARKLSAERADLILQHVPASETRTWRAVARARGMRC